jgi:pimeloyl-ACP methyl ester carboxylesterase
MGRRKMGDLLRAVAHFDARDRLDQLGRPTLIVHGERDLVFEPAAALELARGIPTSRAILIEGADHFAFLTHRKRVVRDLDQFWRSNDL